MASLREFAQRIRAIAGRVESGANRMKIAAAVAIDQAVVMATPVGDPNLWQHSAPPGYVGGRARSNWLVGLDVARTDESASTDFNASLNDGQTTAKRAKPGQAIHLTNNLPYIVPLNDGHSRQAPAGFIQTAIEAGVAAARGSRLLNEH